jgi:heparan-sulfate lyase
MASIRGRRWPGGGFLLLIFARAAAGQAGLEPFPPEKVLDALELERAELAPVRAAAAGGDFERAMTLLAAYYAKRTTVAYDTRPGAADAAQIARADNVLAHVFDMGFGYPPQRYGEDIDWMANPVGDIEWVAGVQRFYWQTPLLAAWEATKETKYARGWVRLTSDWIRKHPVDPRHFAWLDIQVGLRAAAWAAAFDHLRGSGAIDGKFLAVLLAGVVDHGRKMSLYPRRSPHNKAVIEAVGLLRLGIMFPELREAKQWVARAWELLEDNVPRQVTPEGVQREWSPSYHKLVASLLVQALAVARDNGHEAPPSLFGLTERMFDFWLAMTAPDGNAPMFGDTMRSPGARPDPEPMRIAARLFARPELAAVAGQQPGPRPAWLSRAFADSGMYLLRSGWDEEATFVALHASPPAISGHDQPDNGTFELYAGGRWLIADSGAYAYPDTPFAAERDWFRRTAAHATLTLDGANSANAPRHLLFWSGGDGDVVVFENESYPRLVHRRTVFFPERRWVVLIDEALGDAPGVLEVHFPFAPGEVKAGPGKAAVRTDFAGGGNLLVVGAPETEAELKLAEGQISFELNRKEPRQVATYRLRRQAPAVLMTVLVPYSGGSPPKVTARFASPFPAGDSRLSVEAAVAGKRWRLVRDLGTGSASIEPLP